MLFYTKTTSGVTVSVQSYFLEDRSNILQRSFFFVYFVRIVNNGNEALTLRRRHWYIYDSGASDYEVEGEGVVGEQPRIQSGAIYEYNSFCVLQSYEGAMEGSYTMERDDGSLFDVSIPRMYLCAMAN